jgi:hypothetical protein
MNRFFVICRADSKYDGTPGDYVFATHSYFTTLEAAKRFAATCAPSREAFVLEQHKDFYKREGLWA